jgi:DNA-binding winged helix-turn-helix (wHTH) protein/TolB-like protein/lipopolysaccharide biosynthesis regulator YciM
MSLETFPGFLLNFSECQMSGEEKHSYWFKSFRLNVEERQLLDNGSPVPLTPKAFDVLATLVERSGQLVEKDELLKLVWADTVVEEANIARIVHTLRKVLGEDENDNKFIETVAKKGYRFVASVSEVREAPGPKSTNGKQNASASVGTSELQIPPFKADASVTQPTAKPKREMKMFLFAVGFLTAVFLIVLLSLNFRSKSSFNPNRLKSVAVLPFKPLAEGNRNESLELGMTDTLINKLSGIRQLIVRPISSVRKYNALDQDAVAAGRELGVDYVLEGNLQVVGEKTRATVRLLSVRDGTAIWSDKCDEHCSTVIELQDAIAARIASALAIELSGNDRKNLAKHYTESTDAYYAYAWGRFLSEKRNPQVADKSIEYLEQAIQLDPKFALAYVTLAKAYSNLVNMTGRSENEVRPKARELVTKALEIDDTLAEAHAALGGIRVKDRDWSGAESSFKRALELNPNSAEVHGEYAGYLRAMKRYDEALAEKKRAVELEPISALLNRDVAIHLYYMRQYDEAIEQCLKTLQLDDDMPTTYRWLAQSYEKNGLYDQAVPAYLKTFEFSRYGPEVESALRQVYATSGWQGFWRKSVELKNELLKKKEENFSPFGFAQTYLRLGDKDQAFAWLEKTAEKQRSALRQVKEDPLFDDLRTDSRYADLVRRMDLEL